ncbi:response regulator transcription factor [Paenibacillus harenae]|uniref:response regulator transcription factor n=1 Tax=Paenibacillus harenae TaxID=306543 RepID=UPI002790F04A|nr:response regulator [Paenibacillus harenae]MDQ0059608.1 two-component system response regulator YesN [Paenibacillus harenae]
MNDRIKVLLVDDEAWTRDIVKTFGDWDSLNMVIIGEADDGMEALKLVEELEPQVVITDMRMPGVDGVRLLEVLNKRFPDIKSVVVSGYDDFQYAKHAVRFQAVDYLLKPVDPAELNAALLKCKEQVEGAQMSLDVLGLDVDVSYLLSPFKSRLRSYYNELNHEGVETVLNQLRAELDSKVAKAVMKSSKLEQVAQELLLLLKELMDVNSQSADSLKFSYESSTFASPGGTTAFLRVCYGHMLDQLINMRKFKNKLNLEEVRKFMDTHYAEPITLEQLARSFYVSKEYLSKSFKQEYRQNITDYLLNLRMVKAKEWLLDESIPIKAIAEMAGYEDVTYFYRVFKKHFGIAPGEMRKNSEV